MDNIPIDQNIIDLEMCLRDLDTNIRFNVSGNHDAGVYDIYQRFEYLQTFVAQELIKWQHDRAQTIVPEGTKFQPARLDQIQFSFRKLAELVKIFENLILSIHVVDDNLRNCALQLPNNLIRSGFFVEEQPPQVLKTLVHFSVTVRQLVPNVGVDSTVKVSILSESQVQDQWKSPRESWSDPAGEVSNNIGTLKLDPNAQNVVCSFGKLRLNDIKRHSKKQNEHVMDEKFAILFQSKLQVDGKPLSVWAISLPVVVIVHVHQEPSAWATIMWDNVFSRNARIPFAIADSVPWPDLANALQSKFQSITECSLSAENLQYLYEKIIATGSDPNKITWRQFAKDALPNRQPDGKKFTFSDWFYAAAKLVRHHLKEPWQKGYVHGFISKQRTAELLMGCAPGTFLLRFADSALGGVSIAYVKYEGQFQVIEHISPFFKEDLAVSPIGKHIVDLLECTTLHPNIWKYEVFNVQTTSKSNQALPVGGYVGRDLRTVLTPRNSSSSGDSLSPSSPSSRSSLTFPILEPEDLERYLMLE